MKNIELQDDSFCFVCGKNNQWGLNLSFNYVDGKIVSRFNPSKVHQGYKGIVHGGIITAILDESMIQAAINEKIMPLTAEISVRFKHPLFVNDSTIVEAEILEKKIRLITAHSLIKKTDGTIIAEAFAKLIPIKKEKDSSSS
jgi:acyl-coenzyme A thioesterase PaaI-like protein